ncbi:MAG: TRAP transporter small permease [Betaproteobacteria bacterium]|nr:TRAP transporter small permease [Betaproteobacteria bacterium]
MRRPLEALDKVLTRAVRGLGVLAGLALLWLMALTVVAAVTRKVFLSPILGVFDLSEVTLLVLVFLGLAYCGRTGGHISVDLIAGLAKPAILRGMDVVVRLCGGAFLLFVAWESLGRALDARVQHEATNMLFIQLFPFFLLVAAGFALYALVLIVQALRLASGADNVDA